MTLPANGHRNNRTQLPYRPANRNGQPAARVNPKQAASSKDYVVNNLQQILASLTEEEPGHPGIHPSLLYRQPQGYVAPSYPVSTQASNRPISSLAASPRPAAVQQAPRLWSGNLLTGHQAGLAVPLAAPGSARHDTTPGMQRISSLGQQRAPPLQNLATALPGRLQQPHIFQGPGGPQKQYQSPMGRPTKLQEASRKPNNVGVAQEPRDWQQQVAYAQQGLQGRFQRPSTAAGQAAYAAQKLVGQTHSLGALPFAQVHDRMSGNVQKPSMGLSQALPMQQKPMVQNQRAPILPQGKQQTTLNPLPGGHRAQVPPVGQQQQSLAYALSLLERNQKAPTTALRAPALPQSLVPGPSSQLTRANYPYNYKPKYLVTAQQKPPSTPKQALFPPRGRTVSFIQRQPQSMVQTQVSPYNPDFLNKQRAWSWGVWGNQASPMAQTSNPPASLVNGPSYVRTAPKDQPTAAQNPVSPQVLLYYYYYPRATNQPYPGLTKLPLESTKVGSSGGDLWKGLSNQLSYAAYSNKQAIVAPTPKPTSTALTQGKLTFTQQGQSQYITPSNPPMPQLSGWSVPYVQYPQTSVGYKLPVQGKRKQTVTNGLLNRPIYVETVPYPLYYQLQQVPAFNTHSSTQRYLQRALSDVLNFGFGKHKKKKKRRGTKFKR